MILTYKVNDKEYSVDYKKLEIDYFRICAMSNNEFMENLDEILHFTCIVSFLKGYGNEMLSDEGLIHQLVHLLHIPEEPLIDLVEIRNDFRKLLFI